MPSIKKFEAGSYAWIASLLLMLCSHTYASEWITEKNIAISADIDHDLYAAGANVTLNGKIYGDALIAGNTITINDSILQDLAIAGNTVIVNGTVADDLRCAAGNFTVFRSIGGDLFVCGGNVYIDRDVVIYGDLIVIGADVTFNGTVKGNVKLTGGKVRINGTVEGETYGKAEELFISGTLRGPSILAAQKIVLSELARFYGNIRYWQKDRVPIEFGDKMQGGKPELDPSIAISELPEDWKHWTWVFAVIYFLYGLGMIILIQQLFPYKMENAAGFIRSAPLKSLGAGLLYFVLVPVSIIFLFITIAGIPLGLLVSMLFAFSIFFSGVIVAVVVANSIGQTGKKPALPVIARAFLVLVIMKLIGLIPFVGWIANFLITCMVFGALTLSLTKLTPKLLANGSN